VRQNNCGIWILLFKNFKNCFSALYFLSYPLSPSISLSHTLLLSSLSFFLFNFESLSLYLSIFPYSSFSFSLSVNFCFFTFIPSLSFFPLPSLSLSHSVFLPLLPPTLSPSLPLSLSPSLTLKKLYPHKERWHMQQQPVLFCHFPSKITWPHALTRIVSLVWAKFQRTIWTFLHTYYILYDIGKH